MYYDHVRYDDDDDQSCVLSAETLNCLNEFLNEQQNQLNDSVNFLEEDWQLSQFWYNEETANYLANQCLRCIPKNGKIACISCPTLFIAINNLINSDLKGDYKNIEVFLFEYDKRFSLFNSKFIFYDYKEPLSMNEHFCRASFDLVIADPPFLSEECLQNVAITINYLSKSKIILCTGATMEELISKYLYLKVCTFFKPEHKRKLGNEFRCYTNFPLTKKSESN